MASKTSSAWRRSPVVMAVKEKVLCMDGSFSVLSKVSEIMLCTDPPEAQIDQ